MKIYPLQKKNCEPLKLIVGLWHYRTYQIKDTVVW